MSVVGIVILITMILILKLIAQTSRISDVSTVDVAALQKQVESMRRVLEEIQSETIAIQQAKSESTPWIPSAAERDALAATLFRLESEMVETEKTIENAQKNNETLRKHPAIQVLTTTEENLQELQEKLAQIRKDNEDVREEMQAVEKELKPLEEKIEDLDTALSAVQIKQLRVEIPQNQDKKAFILLYGDGMIEALPTDGSRKRRFQTRSALDDWIDSCDPEHEYFVVYVRPSSFAKYEEILKALKAKGFEVGLQVIGEQTDLSLE